MLDADNVRNENNRCLYLALDGDNVGHRLEYFILLNDTESLRKFSIEFASAMSWLEEKLVGELNGEIVFHGGDNLLACFPPGFCDFHKLEEIRSEFSSQVWTTLSFGIGHTPHQAYVALKLAKAGGKDRMRRFEDLTDE